MNKPIWNRTVIITVHAMILLTMGLLIGSGWGNNTPALWVLMMVFAPPVIAILAALLLRDRRAQRIAYIVTAVLMLPAVYFGIWGAWGLLYAIAIVFLLMFARGESGKL